MKKILVILGGLVLAVIVGVAVFISTIDINKYKETALAEVEKATGRKATIAGDLDLSISLNPAIVAEGLSFANADWGSQPQMATVKRVEVQVALIPLLSKKIEIQRFVLIEPRVLLEKDTTGKANWVFDQGSAGETGKASTETPVIPVDFGTVQIEKLSLVYNDAAAKKKTEFLIDKLNLQAAGARIDLELMASLDKTPIEVLGSVGQLATLFNNDDYPLDVTAVYGPVKMKVTGTVKKPMQGQGINLVAGLDVDSLADMGKLTGSALPAIGPLVLSAALSDADSTWQLADLKLRLAESSVSGAASVVLNGEVPYLKADLDAAVLDLVPFQPQEEKEEQQVERYFTPDPLPLDGLKSANADITLRAAEIRTRQAKLTDFSSVLKLSGGRLSIKPLSLKVAGGALQGHVIVDASAKIALLDINLRGKKVELGKLEPLQEKMTGGATDMTIRLKGRGNSTRAIAAGLNGKLLINVGPAELKQDNSGDKGFLSSLGTMINPISREQNSKLSCTVVNFNVKDGIAVAKQGIGVETGQITAAGGGKIDLKTEKLDLAFEPHADGAIAGTLTNLASAIEVGGTLAQPKMKANVSKVATSAIKSVVGGAGNIVGSVLGRDDDRTAVDTAPCLTALGKKPAPKPATKTVEKSTEKPPAEEKSATEQVLDAPKKLLKGLFGD